jgi:hypothetical protein
MRRRVLMGVGAVALGVASVGVMAAPASAANGPVTISIFGSNPSPCFLEINLGIIAPICIT